MAKFRVHVVIEYSTAGGYVSHEERLKATRYVNDIIVDIDDPDDSMYMTSCEISAVPGGDDE